MRDCWLAVVGKCCQQDEHTGQCGPVARINQWPRGGLHLETAGEGSLIRGYTQGALIRQSFICMSLLIVVLCFRGLSAGCTLHTYNTCCTYCQQSRKWANNWGVAWNFDGVYVECVYFGFLLSHWRHFSFHFSYHSSLSNLKCSYRSQENTMVWKNLNGGLVGDFCWIK